LDFESINPFEDILDLDFLVKDSRLNWTDEQLFTLIANNANANLWISISNNCPIEILKKYLLQYIDNLDWTSLSFRIDDEFLVQNAIKFPWKFEVVSAKDDISIEVIKKLLLIPEIKEHEWDWERIMPNLDIDFIKANINLVDFDLYLQTQTNGKIVKQLIVHYPSKKWDWFFISTYYDLLYILENINVFSKFLNLKNLIKRVFLLEKDIELFSKSADFINLLSEAKESTLKDYQPNHANYFWTDQLIDLLEPTGYLTWKSGNYITSF